MKTSIEMKRAVITIVMAVGYAGAAFGHGVEIGAVDTNGDTDLDKLQICNRSTYDGAGGSNVQASVFLGSGAGIMPGTFLSTLGFEAKGAGLAVGNRADAALMNDGTAAFVQLEFLSVSGPAGARFGVIRDATVSTVLTVDLPVGTVSPGVRLDLSEGIPGEPFGDLLSNGLFFSLPGDYQIVIRAVDRDGAFAPSEPLTLAFSTSHVAPPDDACLTVDVSGHTAAVTFPSANGTEYFLMMSMDLQTWTPVGDASRPWEYAIVGTNGLITRDTGASTAGGRYFFRYTSAKP